MKISAQISTGLPMYDQEHDKELNAAAKKAIEHYKSLVDEKNNTVERLETQVKELKRKQALDQGKWASELDLVNTRHKNERDQLLDIKTK